MARKGAIEIPVAVDTGGVEKSIQNGLIDPIEDAEKALEALGKTDAGRDIDRDLKRAQDATEDLDDELDRTRKSLDKLGFAAKDAGTDGAQGLDKIKSGAQEVQREVGANLGEAVSSIRGDFSDLGQVGQDTLGGLAATVAGMGPAGLLGAFALAAGAAGLGAVTAGMDDARERQEKLNEESGKWAEKYIESADRIIDAAAVVAEFQSIATDPERYADAQKAAEEWGTETSTAMLAISGDATALGVVQQIMASRTEEANRLLAEQEVQVDGNAGAVYDFADQVERGNERLALQNDAMAQGRERADAYAEGLFTLAKTGGVATGEVDDLGNAIYKLPDGTEIVVDAVTQTAYEDIDALEKKQINDKSVKVTLEPDDSKLRSYRPQPIKIPATFETRGRQLIG